MIQFIYNMYIYIYAVERSYYKNVLRTINNSKKKKQKTIQKNKNEMIFDFLYICLFLANINK